MAIFWLPFAYILLILVFFWIHFGTLDTVKNIFGHWLLYRPIGYLVISIKKGLKVLFKIP